MDDENTQGETQTPQSPKSNNPNPMLIGAVVVAVILAAVAGLFFMNKNKQAETVNDTSTASTFVLKSQSNGYGRVVSEPSDKCVLELVLKH
jgi:flagellar basal body-associated protein FliL